MAQLDYQEYVQLLKDPNNQRLLRSIRFGEGTERGGYDSYRVMYGGGLAPNLTKHPDTVVRGGEGRPNSAAAGAYQFMPGTWQAAMNRLGPENFPVGRQFNPEAQDVVALSLARQRLLPLGGLAALNKAGITPEISNALAPEWASFPTFSGQSYYPNQSVKKLSGIQAAFGGAEPLTGPPPLAPTTAPATEQFEAARRRQEYLDNYARYTYQAPLIDPEEYRQTGAPKVKESVQKGNQFAGDVVNAIKASILGSVLSGTPINPMSSINAGINYALPRTALRGLLK
jgi:muramidase (phage lysozyme)